MTIVAERQSFIPAEPITDPLELTKKIREIVAEHPDDWDQGSWITPVDGHFSFPSYQEFLDEIGILNLRGMNDGDERACGTNFCIAGWACTLAGAQWRDMHTVTVSLKDRTIAGVAPSIAIDLMKLDTMGGVESDILFDEDTDQGEALALLDEHIAVLERQRA